MSDDHVCTLYCEGDVHAMLLTGRAGLTLDMIERWAMCFGYCLHEARRVLEVDLATEQRKRAWNWHPVTEALTPYRPTEALPTDEVWMVRVSLAPRETTPVHVGGPASGRWWTRWRWRRKT